MKDKIKICGLCHKEIKLESDTYCHIEDFAKGNFFAEGWYHTSCWNENFNVANQMKNKVFRMMNRVEKFLPEEEEVIKI